MLSIPLPFSARLDLALPFAFLPSYLRTAFLVLIVFGFLVVVAKLYRAELRRVSGRVARLLLGLRLSTVAAVCLLFAAGPVFIRNSTEPRRGRVVLAVDVSESMRVADPERSVLDKLRLARVLNLHAGIASDELLASWIEDVGRTGEPTLPASDSDADIARRGKFVEVIDRASAITRSQVAERLLPGLRQRLEAHYAVEVIEFGGGFTDLKVPLARAADGRDEPPAGVVLLTDGRHNTGDPPRPTSVPVFAVGLAPRDPPVDVAVVAVAPAITTVCRGSSVAVDVRVKVSRWAAGPLDVTLKFADGRPPLSKTVNHAGSERVYDVTFHPRFDRVGPSTLSANVTTAPLDRLPDNNTRSARVSVIDTKPRVLLIDGESRWEHHYLHAALSRSTDPPLDVKSVLFRQPRFGTPDDSNDLPALKLPDALEDYECVVLGDATAEQLPPKDRERLKRYVSDVGGTLVVVAGKRAMPLAFADDVVLQPLFPILNPRVVAHEVGFRPSLTPDGLRSWFLRLGDTPEQSKEVWDSLPPHFWGVVGEAKEGADVLACVADSELRLSERQSALVARQHYGFGRVLFVGLDSTWRWRFKTGDQHHHRFWKQTIQWAVAGRLLPTTSADGGVRLGTREAVYRADQEVEFVIRAGEKLPRPGENAAVKVTRSPNESVASYPLAEIGGNERELSAWFRNLAPGRYAVEPDVPEWADQLRTPGGRLRAEFEVLAPESDEMSDLSGNTALLEELAAASGGGAFDVFNVRELADEIAARLTTHTVERPTPLRRSWWTLAVVVMLLAAEWVVRKFAGLP